MPLWAAFAPYLLLIVLIMLAELVPPVSAALGSITVGFAFPELVTGFGVRTEATDAYSAFAPLTHPGTFLLISSVLAFILYRSRGDIPEGRIDEVAVDTVKTSIPSVISLIALLALANVLQGAGMVRELALGVATVANGPIYAFVSPLIGMFGGFLTGSNLSSNILFGPLQLQAANALSIDASIVLAAQTAGAAIGGAIAISTVLLGLGSVGQSGRTGEVIRRTLPYAAASLVVIGVITVVGVLAFGPAEGQAAGGAAHAAEAAVAGGRR
jgi:lactate permease